MSPIFQIVAAFAAGLSVACGQSSTIDPAHPFAWEQNTGWVRLRYDSTLPAGGIAVGEYFLRGFAWSQNTGWINFGSGTPLNNIRYRNSKAADCGVNHAGNGDLTGYAWSQNAGWINFGWAVPSDPNRPRIPLSTGAFSGYAWGQNTGWLNLATGLATLGVDLNDPDSDGMDDSWETEWLNKPTLADATTDYDGDGATDLEEFLAGTHPADPSSRLQIPSLTLDEGGSLARLLISASPTRFYRVSRSTGLLTWDHGKWQEGQMGTMLFKEPLQPPADGRVFFRISVKRPLTP
jgi:hypothetical protein